MLSVPVLIIGCGPIGLTGALLLSRLGIKTLIVDKRSKINNHPRSRLVDTNTMEIMRELGVEKEVEVTGLGPDWTQYNRWFDALAKKEIARIPSPTFHTIARESSPCLPVMTCQDYVEEVLLKKAMDEPNIELRFLTQAVDLKQTATETQATLTSRDGRVETVVAQYTIGADGPQSNTRSVIDSVLEADPRDVNSQDVIFEADLSKYVEGRKGGLLYNATEAGVLVFQPLDGKTRWRCQIVIPSAELIVQDAAKERIKLAIGTEDDINIEIKSMTIWQPTPGSTSHYSRDRIFLAGDAAHISVPTGGMGNNTGFAGIRNLAWKLAYVLKGVSPPTILETYNTEHRPLALRRIEVGVQTYERMIPIFAAHYANQDVTAAALGCRQYGDYDGVLLGYELSSALLAKDKTPPPTVEDETIDFVPVIRSGRRAPHIWLNKNKTQSVLDWFGLKYTLLAGSTTRFAQWQDIVNEIATGGFPIHLQFLPHQDSSVYSNEELVLVRPDGVIVDHWHDDDVENDRANQRLRRYLPALAL